MALRNLKTIVFDLGRVMVSIDPAREKFSGLMRSIGIDPHEAFNRFWYVDEVSRHMTGGMSSPDFYEAVRGHYGLDLGYEEFAEAWCDLFTPMEGMEELFGELAAKYRMGILSDTDPLHWEKIRGMLPCLAAVEKPTLSFNVGLLKPHPEMFDAVAADNGCEKKECLFIDDLVSNVDGARYFGMQALPFSGVEKLRQDLKWLEVL